MIRNVLFSDAVMVRKTYYVFLVKTVLYLIIENYKKLKQKLVAKDGTIHNELENIDAN